MLTRAMGLLLLLIGSGWAQTYTVTDLGELRPFAINAEGAIIGQLNGLPAFWIDGTIEFLPFEAGGAGIVDLSNVGEAVGNAFTHMTVPAFWFNGTFAELPTLGPSLPSSASGISPDTGIIVGVGLPRRAPPVDGGRPGGALGENLRGWRQWPDGRLEILPTLGGDGHIPGSAKVAPQFSAAWDVSNNGTVVGSSRTVSGFLRATRWDVDGSPTDLGTLGGAVSTALGVSDSGIVVGTSALSDGTGRPFRTTATGMLALPNLPAPFMFCDAGSINVALVAVGTCGFGEIRTEVEHAVRWAADTSVIDLNDVVQDATGWVLERANGINDAGLIIGDGTFNGVAHGFLLTPVVGPARTKLSPAAK